MPDTDGRDDHPEWSRLMAAAQDGDRAAYERLLREITPLLRRVAARRLHQAGAADVEDVVQDVLLSVHTVRHTYEPRRAFLPWLMAIQRHRIADWQRRTVRRGRHELAVDSLEETFPDRAANSEGETTDEHREVRAAVATLPPAQRQALELIKLRELSVKEAAERTGTTETALKVATHRGMKALRALLGRNGEHG